MWLLSKLLMSPHEQINLYRSGLSQAGCGSFLVGPPELFMKNTVRRMALANSFFLSGGPSFFTRATWVASSTTSSTIVVICHEPVGTVSRCSSGARVTMLCV